MSWWQWSTRCAPPDPLALGDGETVVALHRQLERLSGGDDAGGGAFDAGRAWRPTGPGVTLATTAAP